MNKMFPFAVFLAAAVFCGVPAFAAPNDQAERQGVEIKKPAEEPETKPIEKIEEPKSTIPEIPKPIKRPRLSPAEEVELQKEEAKRANGQTTQTEYEIKKDSLGRDSNIKF